MPFPFQLMFSFMNVDTRVHCLFAYPSLKKCSSFPISVIVSNIVTWQTSLVGSTGVVVVEMGSVVTGVGPGGLGSGPVLGPEEITF